MPGDRDKRVRIELIQQDRYDGIRPQGRRRFRTLQSLDCECRGDAREGNCQPGSLFKRRSGSRRAQPFLKSLEDRGYEARRVCRLPGIAAREKFLSRFSAARQHWSNVIRFFPALLLVSLSLISLSGCGSHKKVEAQLPLPPSIPAPAPSAEPPARSGEVAGKEDQDEKIEAPPGTKAIFEETGMASWYGAPYHNRRGSNGEVYNMHAMTAAHRTLPLGSIVRVTNVKTGHTAVVRITDRGPFVEGRVLDLSLAAAKALDVYLPGVAQVRLEVLQVPAPLDTGGRWAVQIGSFADEKNASEIADHLQRRYKTAKVLRFASPVGDWWVRVRVLDDSRERAQSLARETATPQGSVFLVRLD